MKELFGFFVLRVTLETLETCLEFLELLIEGGKMVCLL